MWGLVVGCAVDFGSHSLHRVVWEDLVEDYGHGEVWEVPFGVEHFGVLV